MNQGETQLYNRFHFPKNKIWKETEKTETQFAKQLNEKTD